MEYVQEIALSQITTFDDWSEAPVGAILQLKRAADDPEIIVGMRCHHDRPYLLILGGADKGSLIVVGSQRSIAALDISGLVELRVKEPVPVIGFQAKAPPRSGWAYMLGRYPRQIFMRAQTPKLLCFVQLTGNDRGNLVDDVAALELGEVVIARAPEPMQAPQAVPGRHEPTPL